MFSSKILSRLWSLARKLFSIRNDLKLECNFFYCIIACVIKFWLFEFKNFTRIFATYRFFVVSEFFLLKHLKIENLKWNRNRSTTFNVLLWLQFQCNSRKFSFHWIAFKNSEISDDRRCNNLIFIKLAFQCNFDFIFFTEHNEYIQKNNQWSRSKYWSWIKISFKLYKISKFSKILIHD